MEVNMDPMFKQQLDDVFDTFLMLAGGSIVSLMHVQGGFTRYTASAVELFGLPGTYIPNGAMDWNDYLHPEDRKRYMDVMMPMIEGKARTYDITYRVRVATGEYVNFRAVGGVIRGEDGNPSLIGGALINQGLTENIDPVTVLPNKNAYLEDLAKLMGADKRVFSLKVGISGFSELNKVHGYTYGNRTLQEVAWLIQETVKGRGGVYRMDGAAFTILSDQLDREEIAALYDMIRYRLQRGVQVNGIRNILNANGGLISTFGADADAATVFACLNYAYEESKLRKHGELVDFNGSINYEGSKSLELMNTIRDCVLNDCWGFAIEYEPVFSAKTERMTGAEANIYWEDARYGKVSSADFLPLLERDFVFEELGDFILRQSLTDGVKFLEKKPDFLLCLNVYRIQLESDYFIDNLAQFLKETGFPSRLLSLKFTSDCRFLDAGRLHEIIEKLHEREILVIIDGFGSGVNSVGFMKNEPVDAVCLDSQFIEGIGDSKRDRDILDHLTKMAATCVRHVNVKGVKSKEIRDILTDFSVTTMQGAYFSAPIPFEAVLEKCSAQ